MSVARSVSLNHGATPPTATPIHRHRSHSPASTRTPTQVHHPSSPRFLPSALPLPSLLQSAAGGTHFSTLNQVDSPGESYEAPYGNHLVELDENRQRILQEVLQLFCGKPTPEIFRRTWRRDASFEDPLSKCHGYEQYAPQWFGLAKVFSESKTLSHRVLSSTHQPNRIVYSQKQEYTVRFLRVKKVMKSLVVIDLDEDDKIIKLEDRWNGNGHPTRWGSLWLRRLNAKVVPWLVRVPKMDE